ncbi:hypothetical protein ZHAS_00021231 [Anopheles sinensis]|uniref:Uncharacterized protein n=1 Tax=Anopheles sinensis TaxID=74873 RepID=A0A084WRV8_ANOSI|nr:hypothetical protein ZHAS_00021231 [Anopheles sinensis]
MKRKVGGGKGGLRVRGESKSPSLNGHDNGGDYSLSHASAATIRYNYKRQKHTHTPAHTSKRLLQPFHHFGAILMDVSFASRSTPPAPDDPWESARP